MKTIDLPIGAHVAYDRNESRNYHSFTEAYVFAHRAKGNKHSWYGSKTGNHDTIGLAYSYHWNNKNVRVWHFTWTRPQNIHYSWDHYSAIVELDRKRVEAEDAKRALEKENRSVRLQALSPKVLNAFELRDYQIDDLLRHGYTNSRITIDKIEAIIKAVLADHPATIQSEVEAVLKLL